MDGEQVLALLGEAPRRKKARDDRLFVADLVADGLHTRALQRMKDALELSDQQLAAALGISPKTLSRHRRRPDAKLGLVPSDRLYRLAEIFSLAKSVLGDEEDAAEWLRSPQLGLNNRVPLELVTTEVGAQEVKSLLGRIEWGVLS